MTRLSAQQIAAVSRASTVADTVAAISNIKGARTPKHPVTAKAPPQVAAAPAPKPDDGSDVLALVRAVGLPGFTRNRNAGAS